MNANEALEILSKPWCTLKDLQKLSQLGETNASRLRNDIKESLESKGYILPKNLLPMVEVVKYLKIAIKYLEGRARANNYEESRNL